MCIKSGGLPPRLILGEAPAHRHPGGAAAALPQTGGLGDGSPQNTAEGLESGSPPDLMHTMLRNIASGPNSGPEARFPTRKH